MPHQDDELTGSGQPPDGPPELGHPDIDRQHRVLLERWAAIRDADPADGARRAGARIWFIEQYAREHFAAEEQLMADSRYPEAERHRRRHQQFGARIGRLRLDVTAGRHAVTAADWQWVVDWFERHIQEEDLRLKRHLDAARGEGPEVPWAARGR